jgi:hypothetical protein
VPSRHIPRMHGAPSGKPFGAPWKTRSGSRNPRRQTSKPSATRAWASAGTGSDSNLYRAALQFLQFAGDPIDSAPPCFSVARPWAQGVSPPAAMKWTALHGDE